MRKLSNLYSKTSSVTQNKQQNYQQPAQIQQNSQTTNTQVQNSTPQDYASLYNIGLTVMEQGQNLVVLGDDIFNKKDSIKACGFFWDGANKMWHKPIQHQQAA